MQLYKQYCDGMLIVALRFVQDTMEAEDIVQEAFIKAFTKIDQYNAEVSFGAWLKRIVINRCIDVLKSKRQRLLELEERRESILVKRLEAGNNSKVKKVIKIKIPKKAKLKTNIRHGELKLSSVIFDMQGDISHSTLLANSIDGSNTSINTSYSQVLINSWKNGTLGLNYVDEALLKNVEGLTLNSNSSDINIDYLSGNNIIHGSFGELTIHKILDSFNNLNIILENSAAMVRLPEVDYNLMYRGDRSRFNNEPTKQKTIKIYPEGGSSNRTIIINAKFSHIVMQ